MAQRYPGDRLLEVVVADCSSVSSWLGRATVGATILVLAGCGSVDPQVGVDAGSAAANLTKFVVSAAEEPSTPDLHQIGLPDTAGGMERDLDKETELRQQLDAAEQQFRSQARSVRSVYSAVYDQADEAQGPAGALVFLGAKVGSQDPEAFATSFSQQIQNKGFEVKRVDPGQLGGVAVCGQQSVPQKVAICTWATNDTVGELVPTVPGYDIDTLAALVPKVREDVETTQ